MIRLVLFDIDGTLIHTDGAGVKAFGKAFELLFNIADGAAGMKFAGRTDSGLVRELFNRHGVATTPENFEAFFHSYANLLAHHLHSARGGVFPGAVELIHQLRQLPRPPMIGLLTGNIRLGAEIKLRHYELWDHFYMGAFADEHEDRNRIAAAAHAHGARLHGGKLAPEEVLVIGDTPLDIACGRAIGAKVLAVATGGHSLGELKGYQPDLALNTLEEITAEKLVRL